MKQTLAILCCVALAYAGCNSKTTLEVEETTETQAPIAFGLETTEAPSAADWQRMRETLNAALADYTGAARPAPGLNARDQQNMDAWISKFEGRWKRTTTLLNGILTDQWNPILDIRRAGTPGADPHYNTLELRISEDTPLTEAQTWYRLLSVDPDRQTIITFGVVAPVREFINAGHHVEGAYPTTLHLGVTGYVYDPAREELTLTTMTIWAGLNQTKWVKL